jgi:hypothetical protein
MRRSEMTTTAVHDDRPVTAAAFFAPLTDTELTRNWFLTWQGLGRPARQRLRSELQAAWRARHRHYHDLRHLRECLSLFEIWKGQGEQSEHAAEVSIALLAGVNYLGGTPR